MKKSNNKLKVALLIQGPLKSIGRSGKTSSVDLHKIQSSDVIAYDCRKLITGVRPLKCTYPLKCPFLMVALYSQKYYIVVHFGIFY